MPRFPIFTWTLVIFLLYRHYRGINPFVDMDSCINVFIYIDRHIVFMWIIYLTYIKLYVDSCVTQSNQMALYKA